MYIYIYIYTYIYIYIYIFIYIVCVICLVSVVAVAYVCLRLNMLFAVLVVVASRKVHDEVGTEEQADDKHDRLRADRCVCVALCCRMSCCVYVVLLFMCAYCLFVTIREIYIYIYREREMNIISSPKCIDSSPSYID